MSLGILLELISRDVSTKGEGREGQKALGLGQVGVEVLAIGQTHATLSFVPCQCSFSMLISTSVCS